MPAQKTIVAGVIAVMLLALGMTALITLQSDGEDAGSAGASSSTDLSADQDVSPSDGPDGTDGSAPASQPPTSDSPDPGATAESPNSGSTSEPGSNGESTDPDSGDGKDPLEVPQPTGEPEDPVPGVGETPGSDEPLISPPLPETAVAKGRLVKGYPDNAFPPVPKARIVTSAVSSEGDRLRATLVARSDRSARRIFKFYRNRLGGLGFVEADVEAAPGSMARAFRRGDHSLVVTVVPRSGKPNRYTLNGLLVAQ